MANLKNYLECVARVIVCGLFVLFSVSSAVASEFPVVPLQVNVDAPKLHDYIRYSKTYSNPINIETLNRNIDLFESITTPSIHFGLPEGNTFVVLKVKNTSHENGSWILTTGRGALKYFKMYEIGKERTLVLIDSSDLAVVKNNLRTYQAFSYEIVLNSGQDKTYAIHFATENSTYLPLKIQTYGTFFKARRSNIALVSGVIMGILVLIFLNVIFFTVTGKKEFLWLGLAELAFAVSTLHGEGYTTIYFLYNKPNLSLAVEDVFKCAFAVAMAQFARSFIQTKTNFPKIDLMLKALILMGVVVSVLQISAMFAEISFKGFLHNSAWAVGASGALYLPLVGIVATRNLSAQFWPLIIAWSSLAAYIVYIAFATSGIIPNLPINWHLAGPIGLFEAVFVTLALGLHLRELQNKKIQADANLATSLTEKLLISEQARKLTKDKSLALATVSDQSSLLHASGHDSKQVLLSLNSAIHFLEAKDKTGTSPELINMLRSSADYLDDIIMTTVSASNMVGEGSKFYALSAISATDFFKPLEMIYKSVYKNKGLSFDFEIDPDNNIITDKALLMRSISNFLSNSFKFTDEGGVIVRIFQKSENVHISIIDTGCGISKLALRRLNSSQQRRYKENEKTEGSGSGYRAAKTIIEDLCGKVVISSNGASGSVVDVSLPALGQVLTPCSLSELGNHISCCQLVDYDRASSKVKEDASTAYKDHKTPTIFATYDDTSIVRGRISKMGPVMLLKPLYLEFAMHPLLSRLSQKP